MSKAYAPVVVRDAAAEFRSARLYRGQPLVIETRNPIVGEPSFNSDFFSVEAREALPKGHVNPETEEWVDGTVLRLKQNRIPEHWNESSTLYLGDLSCTTDAKQDNSVKVCAFLECSNPDKRNIVTVINPINTDIKIEPGNILEVVVYVPHFGANARWAYSFDRPEGGKFEFHEMGSRNWVLQSTYLSDFVDTDNPYHMTPRASSWHHPECHEYHYWFRLDKSALPVLRNMENGVYYAGDIVLLGYKGNETEARVRFRLKVCINHRQKALKTLEHTIQIKDFDESAKEDYEFVRATSPINPPSKRRESRVKTPRHTTNIYQPTQSWAQKDMRQVKKISITVNDVDTFEFKTYPISSKHIDHREFERMRVEFRQKPYYYGYDCCDF